MKTEYIVMPSPEMVDGYVKIAVTHSKIEELNRIREKIDDMLWDKVLTFEIDKNTLDNIQQELDNIFETEIKELKGENK